MVNLLTVAQVRNSDVETKQWELAKFRGATGRTGAEAVNVPLYLFAVQRILL